MTNKISTVLPTEGQWGLLWPAVLLLISLAGSSLIACAMPLVAIATLAAATMKRRSAIVTLLLCWAINQVFGFTLHGYPHTLFTLGWGVAIGLGGVLALIVAQMVLRPGQIGFRMVPTLGLAFIAYELALFGFSKVTGWACPFTVDVVAAVATNEALWFAGLWLGYVALGLVLPRPLVVTRQRAR
jgi:hypothetical protein